MTPILLAKAATGQRQRDLQLTKDGATVAPPVKVRTHRVSAGVFGVSDYRMPHGAVKR